MGSSARRRHFLLSVPPVSLGLLVLLFMNGRDRAPGSAGGGPSLTVMGTTERGAEPPSAPNAAPAPVLVRRTARVTDKRGNPLAAKVRIAFSQDGFERFETMEVTPGPDGRLPLDLGASAWVVLSVQAPGHVPHWRPPVTWEELQDEDLHFEMADGVPVGGSSRWVDGRPMAGVRLSFRPTWTPGEFAGQVASRLKIVDEEVTTDAAGRFTCTSLRPGGYRVAFPDHPKWPPLNVSAQDLAQGSLALRAAWHEPARK